MMTLAKTIDATISDACKSRAIEILGYKLYDIEKIGFKVASQIRKRNVDQACSMIESDLTRYHVVVNGEEIALVSAVSGEKRYVRTGGSDTSEDPLMKLGNCE